MSEALCSKCHQHFFVIEHQSGLVFGDSLFLCQECCENTPEAELELWKSTKMQCDSVGMPIGLWLIHEQNKDKPLFVTTKMK